MNNTWKRRSLFGLCAILLVAVTAGAYAAWLGVSGDTERNGNLNLGFVTVNTVGFTAGAAGMQVTGGTDNHSTFTLLPYDQIMAGGDTGDATANPVTFAKVSLSITTNADYNIHLALNGTVALALTGSFYVFVGDDAAFNTFYAALPTRGSEAISPLAALVSPTFIPIRDGEEIEDLFEGTYSGTYPTTEIYTHTFFIILDSIDPLDMEKVFNFVVTVEDATVLS